MITVWERNPRHNVIQGTAFRKIIRMHGTGRTLHVVYLDSQGHRRLHILPFPVTLVAEEARCICDMPLPFCTLCAARTV